MYSWGIKRKICPYCCKSSSILDNDNLTTQISLIRIGLYTCYNQNEVINFYHCGICASVLCIHWQHYMHIHNVLFWSVGQCTSMCTQYSRFGQFANNFYTWPNNIVQSYLHFSQKNNRKILEIMDWWNIGDVIQLKTYATSKK